MSGSFYYGLKARFYGILFQLPWSFFVTVCVLMPVAYVVDQPARILLVELLVYWTLITAIFWLVKDLYAQRLLLEFSIRDGNLCVYKNKALFTMYGLGQIKKVKEISSNSKIARTTLCSGVIVTFDDGCEIPVFDRISNYKKLNTILCGNAMSA